MKKLLMAAMLVSPLALAQGGVGIPVGAGAGSAGGSISVPVGASVNAPVGVAAGAGVSVDAATGVTTGAAAGATVTVASVQDVLLNFKNNQAVVLRGHIVKKLSREKYEFADATGSIRADIDKKYFPAGQPIEASATVEISGELDKSLTGKPEVNVKAPIRVVQ